MPIKYQDNTKNLGTEVPNTDLELAFSWSWYTKFGWRNWGGGDREGPSPGSTDSISLGDPGDQIYNENGPFLLLLNCFSAISVIALVVIKYITKMGLFYFLFTSYFTYIYMSRIRRFFNATNRRLKIPVGEKCSRYHHP